MRLIKWLASRLRSSEIPGRPISDSDHFIVRSDSGVAVNHDTALTYDAVWRAVGLISRSVAGIPIEVLRRIDNEGKERATLHPAYRLLKRKPNQYQHSHDFKTVLTMQALLRGNGYALIVRNQIGQPQELIPMDASLTWPDRDKNNDLIYRTSIALDSSSPREIVLDASDVFHLKGIHHSGDVGISVINAARDSLGLGMAVERHGSKFFSQGARPSVVLEHPMTMKAQEHENFRSSWNRLHSGVDNHFRTVILENGMKLNTFSMSPEDSQFVETLQFRVRVVANWFGVPPHKLGDTTRTSYSSLEQENQAFLDDTIDPWLKSWEAEAWDKLLSDRQKNSDSHIIEFNRKELLRMSSRDRSDFYSSALTSGWMSVNEVRSRENLNPIDGGDGYNIMMNMQPIAESGFASDILAENLDDDDDNEDRVSIDTDAEFVVNHLEMLRSALVRVGVRIGHQLSRRKTEKDRLEYLSDDVRSLLDDFCASVDPVLRSLRLRRNVCSAYEIWEQLVHGLTISAEPGADLDKNLQAVTSEILNGL